MGMMDTARSLKAQERQRMAEAVRAAGEVRQPPRGGESLLRSLAWFSPSYDEIPRETYGHMSQFH